MYFSCDFIMEPLHISKFPFSALLSTKENIKKRIQQIPQKLY